MRTWDDYKNHVNAVDPEMAKGLKETVTYLLHI